MKYGQICLIFVHTQNAKEMPADFRFWGVVCQDAHALPSIRCMFSWCVPLGRPSLFTFFWVLLFGSTERTKDITGNCSHVQGFIYMPFFFLLTQTTVFLVFSHIVYSFTQVKCRMNNLTHFRQGRSKAAKDIKEVGIVDVPRKALSVF